MVDLANGIGTVLSSANDATDRNLKPLELIQRALDQAQLGPAAVECIAIGLGPGSYTGIRSAIALAQGWQLAREVRLIGISTVECLAAQARALGWFGKVHMVIDAQRNELYTAAYEIGETCALAEPLHLAPVETMQARLVPQAGFGPEERIWVVGPESKRWFSEGHVLMPEAEQLGKLAAGRTDFCSGDLIEPIYLRETQFVKAPPQRGLGPGVELRDPKN